MNRPHAPTFSAPMRLLLLALALSAISACTDPGSVPTPATPTGDAEDAVPYRLDAPDAIIRLAPELKEISGLTMLPSGNLGTLQDEVGTIYELDPSTGAIVDRLPFRGGGDFEGLELAGDAVWALRSDGDLYRVYRDSTGTPTSRKIETGLKGRNDTEGLGFDGQGRLLIACKEWPGSDLNDVRSIWAFDLATETLHPEPIALLDRRQVDGRLNFKPSALAVHPISGRVYVLSSVRTALAVLSPDGALLAVLDFPPRLMPQPEGLAFAADGTMYVSSEGTTGPGLLLRYAPTR